MREFGVETRDRQSPIGGLHDARREGEWRSRDRRHAELNRCGSARRGAENAFEFSWRAFVIILQVVARQDERRLQRAVSPCPLF